MFLLDSRKFGQGFLADRQKQVFIATKFGVRMNRDGTRETRNDPEYVRMAIDRSLKRLQTDYVDLYYW